jgi:capsular exopolysaccharide synthesis family protein
MNNKELFPLASEKQNHKDIGQLLAQYTKYWYWFVLSLALCLCSAYAYLKYYAVPEYSITSSLLIKDDKPGATSADESFNLNLFASSKNLNNEIEILESISLMERVTQALGLNITYHKKGKFRNTELYGKQLPIKIVVDRLSPEITNQDFLLNLGKGTAFDLEENGKHTSYSFGQQIKRPYADFTIVADSNAQLLATYANSQLLVGLHNPKTIANNYRQSILIAPVSKDATVVKVSMADAIPERGRDIINKLVEVYNQEALEDKNQTATNTIQFLDERLKFLTNELTGVEKKVEQYKSRNEVTDMSVQASNYLEQASDYNKKLSDWTIQINVLKSIENYLTKNGNQYKLVPSALGIQDPTLAALIAKFNELQLERERMLRTTELSNPLVVNIDQQLANLQTNILESLRNIKNGLLITSNNLRANSGQFKSRIQQVPLLERQLQDINRQQETKQKLYLYLLQKREEAGLSLAGTVANTRIVDSAISTDYPIRPSKQIVYLAALLVGLLVPFGSVYAKGLLNEKVENRHDVEHHTITPIIGELSRNNQGPLVMTRGNRSGLAEMFRLIRTNLHFAANNPDEKVILVTSSMSREGKTFISLNLGATLVLSGKRVAVLEMDLRQPALLQMLDMSTQFGLTDYLQSQQTAIDSLLQPVPQVDGLFVIGAGQQVANPAELMMSPKMGYLLHELREAFDYIIIDTAPVGKVADAFTLSSYINQTIYVVRSRFTLKKQLDIVDSILKSGKLPNPLIVLNDVSVDTKNGYGYGYGEESNQKKRLFSRATI